MRKGWSSQITLEQLDIGMEENEPYNTSLPPQAKFNCFEMNHVPKFKTESIKFLEENIGKNLHSHEIFLHEP